MKQPIRKKKQPEKKSPQNKSPKKQEKKELKKVKNQSKKKKEHPKFGTSKLEEHFAENFLDKLGVKYTWQFEAKEIGRFYDFKIDKGPILEINGGYWHGDPRLYEEKDLNRVQKHAQYVDEVKKKWALLNGIPIYYIWEKDIKEKPDEVMKLLKKILYIKEKEENKKKRHKNKLLK